MADDRSRDVTPSPNAERPLWRKLLWFVGLWALGVGAVAAVAYGIRLWIMPG